MESFKKVALAYSGGLDTSIIIPWLKENYGCEVIAVVGDVGQKIDKEALTKKAIATGASKIYIEDLTDEFVEEFNKATFHIDRNANFKILFSDLSFTVNRLLRVEK